MEPVAKRPKMTATVKPIRAEEPVVTKKAAKKAPIARGSSMTVKAAPKKPVAKKPPTQPASRGVKPAAKASTIAGANIKSGKTKRPAWDIKGRLQVSPQ